MSSLQEIAKAYVKNDKLSVIPVGKDKRPLVPWKEFQTRRASEEEIDKWFEMFPEAQIGIVTGKISNLTVVDIEFGGDPSFLPQETLVIKTGGGGWHYYYTFAEGMMNKARVKELVDIRSEGGYVVAPPSATEKGSYEILKKAKPIPFPRYLFENNASGTASNMPLEASELVSDESYPGYGTGRRNEEMTRFVGRILTQIHPALWDTEATTIIRAANAKNDPPLTERELSTIYKSIKGREINNPSPRDWKNTKKEELVDDGTDEVKHLSEVAAMHSINSDDVYPFGMPYFDQALLGGPNPGDLIIIAGPTGQGKTHFSQDLSTGLMRGEKKCPVLFFSYEVLPQFVWKKYQQMGISDVDPIFIPMKHTSGGIDWIDKKIMEAKKKYAIKSVVVDHLGFLAPRSGNPNQKQVAANYSTFLTQVSRDIKQIGIREELIMITPAHVRKTDDLNINDIANSSGIAQEADIVFLIERERNKSKDVSEYYTPYTKITLAKNRKTGQSVVGWFVMFNGRFMWDSAKNNQEEFWRKIETGEDTPIVEKTDREKIITQVSEMSNMSPRDKISMIKSSEQTQQELFRALLIEKNKESF